MRDYLSHGSGGMSPIKISDIGADSPESSIIWTSDRIARVLQDHEEGLIDIKTMKNSPFKDNDPAWKKQNLAFEYTPEEWSEIQKCSQDIVYFAETYCMIMTEQGIDNIDLIDYQKEIVTTFKDNRFNILMASRQVGKTWMSAVFIAWFLTFHFDKNALAIADNAATTKEVIDKIKTIFENLPFFLKPGCVNNAVMSLRFDNGCRLIGRSTTKKSGIGFNIHLLYIDEFAHINETYLDYFFRSIYPTISASSTSKIIITSTPNGQNKFYDIYMDAVKGKNSFVPLRVDWWQFPGRDEDWKKMTIANLGSEEDFNQEYGLQFFSSDKLLLHSKELKKMTAVETSYVSQRYPIEESRVHLLDHFRCHPNFAKMELDDIRNDWHYYIFAIDTADGLGKDALVINIFKFVPIPINMLLPIKETLRDITDIFGVVQVAVVQTNEININEFVAVLDNMAYTIFNPDRVKMVIELNHKGDFVLDKIESSPLYSPSQIVHSKHSVLTEHYRPGVRLSSGEMKTKSCERFKYMMQVNKIIPNDFKTVAELKAFGKSKSGSFRSQSGHDDLAITCVHVGAFFESPNFWEVANDFLDDMRRRAKMGDEKLERYLARIDREVFVREISEEAKKRALDFQALLEMNPTPLTRDPKEIDRVFSEEGIRGYMVRKEVFRTGIDPTAPPEPDYRKEDPSTFGIGKSWKPFPGS